MSRLCCGVVFDPRHSRASAIPRLRGGLWCSDSLFVCVVCLLFLLLFEMLSFRYGVSLFAVCCLLLDVDCCLFVVCCLFPCLFV